MGKRDRRRIIAARLKLRDRLVECMRGTPALADSAPQGSGPANRHGMPQLPPGQHTVDEWPVLDLGEQPQVATARWRLQIDGAVDNPLELRWGDFLAFEQVEDTSDFHCVTSWSKLNMRWRGVHCGELLARAAPREGATHILCHAYDGYDTNLPLEEALEDDVLLVHAVDGAPLTAEHGGPCRMITPQLWAWKGAKWINRIEVLAADRPGFWEQRGYSNTAHPWRDDRYGQPPMANRSTPPGSATKSDPGLCD